MSRVGTGPRAWTEPYLAAFANARRGAFVTFHRGFARWPDLDCNILSPI